MTAASAAVLEPDFGPLRSFGCGLESSCSAGLAGGGDFAWHRAGIPPRQAGHFFLVAQKEVTKKEGLTFISASVRAVVWRHWRSPPRRPQNPEPSAYRLAITPLWHSIVGNGLAEWASGARRAEKAVPGVRMPGPDHCQSGDRRFGVLRMPVELPPLASPSSLCAGTDGRSGPLSWLLLSGPAERSDPPAGAESRRSAARDHWPRQLGLNVRLEQISTRASGRKLPRSASQEFTLPPRATPGGDPECSARS